ncbi:MAG: IclR family transcriptional regulator, partial [Nitratireductor sp.]
MNDAILDKEGIAMNDELNESRIPTNLRTLLILETVGNSDVALSPTEINHDIGLPKQTIHRLCKTLVQEGFLVYEQHGSRLRPGRRLRNFSAGILQSSRFHILRHQVLTDIGKATGETVNFVMPEDDGMNYVDRVEADWPFRVQLPIGTHVPFHCTASGKVFLSSLRKKHQRTFIHSVSWERRTPNTFTDPEKLIEELRNISKQGYALDLEEFMEGMVAIA